MPGMKKVRLDDEMISQGICADRADALRLLMAGLVSSGGERLSSAGQKVLPGLALHVKGHSAYVGRGGLKLEGALDEQTAAGKVPVGVARRAKRVNPHARVVAVAGARADNLAAVYDAGIDLVLPILRRPMALSEALEPAEARANLVAAGEEAMRAYLLGR